jgi:hypothetical protein
VLCRWERRGGLGLFDKGTREKWRPQSVATFDSEFASLAQTDPSPLGWPRRTIQEVHTYVHVLCSCGDGAAALSCLDAVLAQRAAG